MNVFYQDKYKGGYSFKVALKFKEKELISMYLIVLTYSLF